MGEFGTWTPIGAVQTSGGYEVVWSLPGGNQYSIWTTDSSGHFVSQVASLTGTSYALEAAESVLGQDLNGDGDDLESGQDADPRPTDRRQPEHKLRTNYFLDNKDSGVRPRSCTIRRCCRYGGRLGGSARWVPIGAVQTSGGYEVVWSLARNNQYSVWTTDRLWPFRLTGCQSDGDQLHALEAAEPVLGQDLNGDGTIGLVKTLIQTNGSTSLNQIANEFFLDNNSGVGPELQFGGAAATVGEFGTWVPIGAVQTSGGYEVVWSLHRRQSIFGLDHR